MALKMAPVRAESTWEKYGNFQKSNNFFKDLNRSKLKEVEVKSHSYLIKHILLHYYIFQSLHYSGISGRITDYSTYHPTFILILRN